MHFRSRYDVLWRRPTIEQENGPEHTWWKDKFDVASSELPMFRVVFPFFGWSDRTRTWASR